jgi:hypothetical protein
MRYHSHRTLLEKAVSERHLSDQVQHGFQKARPMPCVRHVQRKAPDRIENPTVGMLVAELRSYGFHWQRKKTRPAVADKPKGCTAPVSKGKIRSGKIYRVTMVSPL